MGGSFISYCSRYREWVATLHRNLERCLAHAGSTERIFFDQLDIASGSSWVGRLGEGLDRAEQLILVLTPEVLTSDWVNEEWQSFRARRGPRKPLHVVYLIDTPKPALLSHRQHVDFRDHDDAKYRQALSELVAGLLGRDRKKDIELSPEIEIPPPPAGLDPELRRALLAALVARLTKKGDRRAAEMVLGLDRNALEGGTPESSAAVALVLATGDDEPYAAARRIVDVLIDELEAEELEPLRERWLDRRPPDAEDGLLVAWLRKVVSDHERLVPYFQQRTELTLLDRVYVQLQLAPGRHGQLADTGEKTLRDRGPWSLQDLLTLDPAEHTWVSRRWIVLGDPGAGKTTLLRHLAATVARQEQPHWVPVFESLARWVREPEWLLDRLARQMRQVGEPAAGLPAVLDHAGHEGRLLLLLDGLDEVPKQRLDDAEALLRRLAARWPQTPLVVTSRPIGYRRPASDFQELDLLPLGRKGRQEFLSRWFGRESGQLDTARGTEAATALEQNAGLRELASNPLYLTLMALLIEQGIAPDRNRPQLYDQVFQLLLKGEHRNPPTPMERPAAVRRMLCYLGYSMTEDNLDAEPVDALEDRLYRPEADKLRGDLERVARWHPRLSLFLEELASSSGILGPHDGPEADWRYWHRTFREALAAEALAARCQGKDGQAPVLAHAAKIVEADLSRWAEPYALLSGQVDDPDGLVRALIQENRPLGLRALATAQSLSDATLREVLELSEEWQDRIKVYEQIPELIDDPIRALALLDRLRQRTRNGNDLFFLERAVALVTDKWPDAKRSVEQLAVRFYDHIPAPPEELFRWIETPLDGRVKLWRKIPAGEFVMGSPKGESGSYDDERPQYRVTLKQPFGIAAVPVTVAQYAAFDSGHSPYHRGRVPDEQLPTHPVETVTWYQAIAFCRWLSRTFPWARGARLPTEEEWEYACRAGSTTRYWSGDGESDLARVGWYEENSSSRTHPVGEKPANRWDLYDVHGNVWEWTLSEWTDDYSGRQHGTQIDSTDVKSADPADSGSTSGAARVIRGGSCWGGVQVARSAYRLRFEPLDANGLLGFRVVLPAAPSDPR